MSASIQNRCVMPGLKPYVDDILLVESDGKDFDCGLDIIEPDGTVKLAITLNNRIQNYYENNTFIAQADRVTMVGMFDSPFKMEALTNCKTQLLIVRLNAIGAYRFININHESSVNKFHQFYDVLGGPIRELEDLLANEKNVLQKIIKLQMYLQGIFGKVAPDLIFDHCVNKIIGTSGSIALKVLEDDTGYSSRWLNMKFKQKIGMGPKSFASIIRFKDVFKKVVTQRDFYLNDRIYLDHYYDQAHFLKDFKRYSGQTPSEFYSKS